MPWDRNGWARVRALARGRDRFKTTGQKRGTVSATVLHMSEVRELREALRGA